MNLFSRKTEGGVIYIPPACEVKVTEGGAKQFRWRLPTGGKMSLSVAPENGKADRRGHFHKGLTEVYTVHAGQIGILWQCGASFVVNIVILDAKFDCTFTVSADVRHAVLQTSGSVFVTQTIGTPVPNSNRGGNDWYAAEDEFNREIKKYFHIMH